FNVSGVFRDQGDFAVLVLFHKDDPFGHPRFSYLPDGNFTGLKLDFDIEWQGTQAFESKKWPWTDWAYLNCLLGNGQTVQKPLFQFRPFAAHHPAFVESGVLSTGENKVSDPTRRQFAERAGLALGAGPFLNLNPPAKGANEQVVLALIGGRKQGVGVPLRRRF